MTASRARVRRRGRDRRPFALRRAASLLGVLALLIQLAAGMIPMPLALGSGNAETASADLCLAPDSPLAHRSSPADDAKGKAGDPAHDCQICLTLQLAGHFLPAVPAAVAPQRESLFCLLLPAESETPALARHASAAPRAPPAIA
jgi:hypothetical protein